MSNPATTEVPSGVFLAYESLGMASKCLRGAARLLQGVPGDGPAAMADQVMDGWSSVLQVLEEMETKYKLSDD